MQTRRINVVCKRDASRGMAAFTLLELLIVIGIIALLLGILFPVLGSVRKSAKGVKTEALMRQVIASVDQFMIDNRRPPGRFSPRALGRTSNETRGFTEMESALLELAGGEVDESKLSSPPDTTSVLNPFIRDVGPFDAGNIGKGKNIPLVDTSAVGAVDGPGYLTLKGADLFAIGGQWTTPLDVSNPSAVGGVKGMPDVVDAFGQPLMMWVQDLDPAQVDPNPQAGGTSALFSQINSDASKRGSFYWNSNAGYLRANMLGADRINQLGLSMLSVNSDDNRKDSLRGVLGSPAFPRERANMNDEWQPAKARGAVVVISAGQDRVFFKHAASEAQSPSLIVGYAPRGESATKSGMTVKIVDDFDDLIASTGG